MKRINQGVQFHVGYKSVTARLRGREAVPLEPIVGSLTEAQMAGLDDGTWHCMTDAPRDGTEVELLVRHVNYRYCTTDEERAQWEQVARSTWIDFNGGGWTWHGIAGQAVGWRPLSSNASLRGAEPQAEHPSRSDS